MGEASRGPLGRNAKQSSVYGATNALDDGRRQEKSFDSPNDVTELERLRVVHARLARIIRHLRAINDQLGGRAMVEITIRLAELTEALKVLDEFAARWRAHGKPHWLRATDGDRFLTEFSLHIIRDDR
jgi:hypothetical protein